MFLPARHGRLLIATAIHRWQEGAQGGQAENPWILFVLEEDSEPTFLFFYCVLLFFLCFHLSIYQSMVHYPESSWL